MCKKCNRKLDAFSHYNNFERYLSTKEKINDDDSEEHNAPDAASSKKKNDQEEEEEEEEKNVNKGEYWKC